MTASSSWLAGLAAVVAAGLPLAAQDTLPRRLPPVTVTRDAGRSPLDLPFAISTTRPDSLVPGLTHTLIEQTLALLPGVTVANRVNPSQDTRVSIRGFGARSQFGARSIRILRDGMPLTLPDGQTPIDYLDLESVGRVEVIRGATAALYGNAAGGVIDLRSIEPPDAPLSVQGRFFRGADGLHGGANQRRFSGLFGGRVGGFGLEGNIGDTKSTGYRDYAHQKLTNAFVRATRTVGRTDLAFIGMGLDMPVAENPGAITLAQADSAPWQADRLSVQKKARKAVHQVQLGFSATQHFNGGGELFVQGYGGTRTLYNPLTFAVVGIDRRQSGGALRLTLPQAIGSMTNRFSVGADAQWLDDARKNWANCNGLATANATCPSLATEKGNLSLDQSELVSNIGPYVRDEIEVGRLRASAGVRSDRVRFELRDHFLSDGRNDSGIRTMKAVSPINHYNLFAVRADKLAEKRDAFVRVIAAFIEAGDYLRDPKNLDRVAEIAAVTGRTPEEVKNVLPQFIAIEFWPNGNDGMTREKLESVIRGQKALGGIKADRTPVAYEKLVDTTVWRDAVALTKKK